MKPFVDRLRALGDDTRFRLMRVLLEARDALCVCELVDVVRRPQYAVSRAMTTLRRAGLVREHRRAKLVFYEAVESSDNDGLFHAILTAQDDEENAALDRDRLRWRLDLRVDGECRVTYTAGYAPPEYANVGPQDEAKRRPRVLFVCVHNSARSQIAEEYLRAYAGDVFDVESAGLEPGALNPVVVDLLKEDGIDISGKATRGVVDLYRSGTTFDWVITVCSREAEEKCPIFPGPMRRLNWPFPDPSALTGSPQEVVEETRMIRESIKAEVRRFADEYRSRRAAVAEEGASI